MKCLRKMWLNLIATFIAAVVTEEGSCALEIVCLILPESRDLLVKSYGHLLEILLFLPQPLTEYDEIT